MTNDSEVPTGFRVAPPEQVGQIVAVFARVQWPLSVDGIDAVVSDLGWSRRPNVSRIEVVSSLPLARRDTTFLQRGDEVSEVSCWVTDPLKRGEDQKVVNDAYYALHPVIIAILGQPNNRGRDSWWDLPTGGRVHLKDLKRVVLLQLLSRWYADVERSEERLGISPDRVLGEDE